MAKPPRDPPRADGDDYAEGSQETSLQPSASTSLTSPAGTPSRPAPANSTAQGKVVQQDEVPQASAADVGEDLALHRRLLGFRRWLAAAIVGCGLLSVAAVMFNLFREMPQGVDLVANLVSRAVITVTGSLIFGISITAADRLTFPYLLRIELEKARPQRSSPDRDMKALSSLLRDVGQAMKPFAEIARGTSGSDAPDTKKKSD